MDLNRKILFQALVGSHNYNLNDEHSDLDYKIFTLPTFDDLYHRNQYAKAEVGITADYDVHDIRKLVDLVWKSNINFVEVLFSKNVMMDIINLKKETHFLLKELFGLRDEIAVMNLPYLYNACIGMYYSKMKLLHKGTAGTQHLVDKYGWDTKQGMHAYRCLDFLDRFAENNFTSFKDAMYYNDDERDVLLKIKYGEVSLPQFEEIVHNKLQTLEEFYKSEYQLEPNIAIKNKLEHIIKQIIKIELEV